MAVDACTADSCVDHKCKYTDDGDDGNGNANTDDNGGG